MTTTTTTGLRVRARYISAGNYAVTANGRRTGYEISRGAYRGATDDRHDGWYIDREGGDYLDRRGPGAATLTMALERVADWIAAEVTP